MQTPRYTIVETDLGPLIPESRSSVYDVLEMHNKGYNIYEISMIFNLTPLQVQTALDYIEPRRELLEAELAEILVKKAEREQFYRAQAEEIRKQIAQLPMTPQRAAFYALREKNRRAREAGANGDHPQ